ncbi:hypothetical protein GXW78_07540 [Roseomonas terrae]|uniref:Uncharacterized protein n=1 Tax=Neoroseomonas terrae TaxID=424799 RepID=A0ABS5EER4_9PROT|nr:hypothetical protein [Neoroseomonas terrae]MBR0649507.1 hypothetical protein [Neoroseomonas terrae]
MTKPIVSGGVTIDVPIPGTDRSFTLHAPTFGEFGEIVARSASMVVPNDAIFVDALRQEIQGSGLPEEQKAAHLAALDADETAQDALTSHYAAFGPDRSTWSAEERRDFGQADRDASAARRRRMRAEWAMREAKALIELRRHQIEEHRSEQLELLAICLRWKRDAVAALPTGDVEVLHAAAMRLVRPGPAAEKN